MMTGIGTLNEKPLHAALKEWIAEESAAFEVKIDGYFIDVVQGGGVDRDPNRELCIH